MIDETEADAIVIATPAASHVEICTRALGRGLCVLLEKPVATSAEAASALLASCRKSAAFVLPGHVLRFSKDHQRLVEIVDSGLIGEVIYVSSRRYRDDSHAIRYRDTDPVLMTLIHDVDLAQWVTRSTFRSVLVQRSGSSGYRSMTTACATMATGGRLPLAHCVDLPGGRFAQGPVGGGRRSRERRAGGWRIFAALLRGTPHRCAFGRGGRFPAQRTGSFSGVRPRPVTQAGAGPAAGARRTEAGRRGERSHCAQAAR